MKHLAANKRDHSILCLFFPRPAAHVKWIWYASRPFCSRGERTVSQRLSMRCVRPPGWLHALLPHFHRISCLSGTALRMLSNASTAFLRQSGRHTRLRLQACVPRRLQLDLQDRLVPHRLVQCSGSGDGVGVPARQQGRRKSRQWAGREARMIGRASVFKAVERIQTCHNRQGLCCPTQAAVGRSHFLNPAKLLVSLLVLLGEEGTRGAARKGQV